MAKLRPLEMGQKFIPLTIAEVLPSRREDINFASWRELYLNMIASNLVLNFVCPSFPLINSWFYIQNTRASIFDNLAMHDRYKHSDIAREITNQVRAADMMNYIEGDKNRGPINNRFLRLSSEI